MNVKRIVVDRIPHSCSNCHYIRLHQPIISGEVFPYACGANRISKQIEGEVELYRPEWCPLEVEEVCEWKKKDKATDGDYDIYVSPHYPNIYMSSLDHYIPTFCGDCGKRIVYKESE